MKLQVSDSLLSSTNGTLTLSKEKIIRFNTLRKLLLDISTKDSKILMRLTLNDGTHIPFSTAVWLNRNSLLMQQEIEKTFFAIEDIQNILSFEISHPVSGLIPDALYKVRLSGK